MEKQLTFDDVKKLRSEIVLNSLYTHDYENSFGISPIKVQNFFDGFMEFIAEKMQEDCGEVDYRAYYRRIWEYDTDENLEEWWNCFDEYPFADDSGEEVESNIFDVEELHENCTVQILRNTITGELSVGWWEND